MNLSSSMKLSLSTHLSVSWHHLTEKEYEKCQELERRAQTMQQQSEEKLRALDASKSKVRTYLSLFSLSLLSLNEKIFFHVLC